MFVSPFHDLEEKLGANFGGFAGWEMPMSFTSYAEEHMSVRSSVAFFNLSHMGRLRVKGNPKEFEMLVAKEVSKTNSGNMIGPTAFLNDKAGFKDDVMVYKVSENEWLIVTNAINREKIVNWIKSNSNLDVDDLTFKYGMIAIQGRKLEEILGKNELKPLEFKLNTKFMGYDVFLVSKSGWTGENGLEVWVTLDIGRQLIMDLVKIGIKPAGLIARDSLRQEMGFVLYGEDIDETITPVEARYWVFSLEKDFIGKDSLVERIKSGIEKVRIGFKMKKGERIIPRHPSKIYSLGNEAGYVTSSTFSPYLNRVIGMGYVNPKYFYLGYNLAVEIRSKQYDIKIDEFPFI
ncbi:glycine cleavage system aminomethyltransferase GcvT [Saccharolobus islandicus]|uniref:aminomethyltransferase n=3 Tax=Saccharolobus islandicus TaxID=43080 RepID=M9UEF5_SACIS|nr:glycine cleavage system aminomethyltransferase GcvT [Sulfolobus islandicus]ADX82596.1 glycine cleavage system T protein [Sulfolobus islandicus HVE10/4]ADX85232.1 glycine cleavage system T protein [Sulfolobus islandicus REY15A]AGJ62610.1 Glycine cleavage system T protein (aminomethyltransferase) [Sulfolobus islandicus LAL14/1]WCM36127.1 glycine cleavage system aminomethyltransferase GcvT [Sulfolobus islandicus]